MQINTVSIGKKLFKESLLKGTMENYFCLAEQYTTQSEPEYCGPASLTMVLNSLNIDPNRPWKGQLVVLNRNHIYRIWRWFSEEILHCTTSDEMKKGMNLEQITQLARCNGLHTLTFRPMINEEGGDIEPKFKFIDSKEMNHSHNEHTNQSESCCAVPQHPHPLEDRHHLIEDHTKLLHHNTSSAYVSRCDLELLKTAVLASTRKQGLHMIANLSRKTLQQTGDGHFTPIGGYHQAADKVLVFDTARFKYPPHWIDMGLLYQSICTQDSETHKMRGLIAVSKKRRAGEVNSKICSIQVDFHAIHQTAKILCQQFRQNQIQDFLTTFNSTGQDSIMLKLNYILCQLNDSEIRTIFFVYLHELVNRYSNQSSISHQQKDGSSFHLSHDFGLLIKELKLTPVYKTLNERRNELEVFPLTTLFDYFLPDQALELFTLVLYSLPKQVFYQMSINTPSIVHYL